MSDLIKKIYKYPLEIIDEQVIEMPVGADILTVQLQNNHPMLWALLTDTFSTSKRTFRVIGTGQPIFDHTQLKYIATFQTYGLVFHVFEKGTL